MVHNPPFARNYAPDFIVMERGRGSYLRDRSGKRYLDFGAGIAVNALGYGRRDLARVAARQMRKIVHISNLYTSEPAVELAQRLVASGTTLGGEAFGGCFFGNSGTEANEAALKFARLYASSTRGADHHHFLSFTNAFHGRTMGALSVTPNKKYREKFEPLISGTETLPYNDLAALRESFDARFAAVIVEVVQGEGGLTPMTREFAETLSELCREHDVLLIADEIQTALGRTGSIFASSQLGLQPDIVTLSKPLAGGLPLSATLIPKRVNDALSAGDHGTTFGGGPVTTAVGIRVWDEITDPSFLARVGEVASQLDARLRDLAERFDFVGMPVGMGLLRGIPLEPAEGKTDRGELTRIVMAAAAEQGLLLLRSGANRIRIAPPLVIKPREIDRGIAIIEEIFEQLAREDKV
jgi:acetylornithine/N-succinyldiaminopimelate aminotransferase